MLTCFTVQEMKRLFSGTPSQTSPMAVILNQFGPHQESCTSHPPWKREENKQLARERLTPLTNSIRSQHRREKIAQHFEA